jgi:carbonic anhydrase
MSFLCTASEEKKDDKKEEKREEEIEPIIYIPLQSRTCNQDWNYQSNGDDWECECKTGKKQSPIDLPSIGSGAKTKLRPIFSYPQIKNEETESRSDDLSAIGDRFKVKYHLGHIVIYGSNFGKIVTVDGTVYKAMDIIIHTPAQHSVNGEKFDLEVEIVHYGRSVGDISKKAVLSILFRKKAGVDNKFFQDIGFMDLPNPNDREKDIKNDSFILENLISDGTGLSDFSFFQYDGSLTAPPCTEDTIYFVNTHIQHVSSMTIELFKDALLVDTGVSSELTGFLQQSGNLQAKDSSRSIQKIYNRNILYYDSGKTSITQTKSTQAKGHYERIPISINEISYFKGKEPSGIPGSFVVADEGK